MKNIPKKICVGEYEYELFIPTILRPYKMWFQEMYWKRYIRLCIQALRGSVVFYMKNQSGKVLGYIHLERGNARYPWATSKDWIISPYAIRKECRGKGIGSILIRDFYECLSTYVTGEIYAETNSTNDASISVLEKNGFEFIGHAVLSSKGIKKYRIVPKPSEYRVYKLQRYTDNDN